MSSLLFTACSSCCFSLLKVGHGRCYPTGDECQKVVIDQLREQPARHSSQLNNLVYDDDIIMPGSTMSLLPHSSLNLAERKAAPCWDAFLIHISYQSLMIACKTAHTAVLFSSRWLSNACQIFRSAPYSVLENVFIHGISFFILWGRHSFLSYSELHMAAILEWSNSHLQDVAVSV